MLPRRGTRLLAAALAGLLIVGPVAAADPAQPADGTHTAALRGSLAHVPADALAPGTSVAWVDLRAVIAARPGAADPTTTVAFTDALAADDAASAAWRAALMGIASGPVDLLGTLLVAGTDWPAVVGFDPTQLDRLTGFGAPPANGIVAEGRFSPDAIGAALAARGFVAQAEGAFTRWCSPEGCAAGLAVDLAGREPADPFGGRLGRRQPLAVAPDVLLGSADDATVTAMIAATTGSASAFVHDPYVAAALAALDATADGRLLQAELVRGADVLADVATLLAPLADPAAVAGTLADLAPGFVAIAPAALILVADGATADAQVVRIVLVLPSRADAEAAAAVVPARLRAMPSIVMEAPWADVLARAGVTDVAGRAVPADDGLGVAVIEIRAPLAGSAPDAEATRPEPSSRLHGLFVRALRARDLAWLAPALGGPPAG